jgi:hypothetical protein
MSGWELKKGASSPYWLYCDDIEHQINLYWPKPSSWKSRLVYRSRTNAQVLSIKEEDFPPALLLDLEQAKAYALTLWRMS